MIIDWIITNAFIIVQKHKTIHEHTKNSISRKTGIQITTLQVNPAQLLIVGTWASNLRTLRAHSQCLTKANEKYQTKANEITNHSQRLTHMHKTWKVSNKSERNDKSQPKAHTYAQNMVCGWGGLGGQRAQRPTFFVWFCHFSVLWRGLFASCFWFTNLGTCFDHLVSCVGEGWQ